MDNYELIKSVDILTTTYTITMNQISEYTFTIRAYNFYGESVNSNIGVQPSKPNEPTLLESTTSSISILWDPVEYSGGVPITKYSVYYDPE